MAAPVLRIQIPLLCVTLLAACTTTSNTFRQGLAESQAAYRDGEVLRAYALLSGMKPGPDQAQATEYAKLLAQVTQATEHLIERWLERGEYWKRMGDPQRALRFFGDLLDRLPAGDPLHELLEKRAAPIRRELSDLREEQQGFLNDARRMLAAGKAGTARKLLLQARWHAREHNLEFSLEHERLLAECERRIPGSNDHYYEEVAQPEPKKSAGEGTREKARPRRPPRAGAKPPPKEAAEAEDAAGFDAEVEALYRRGEVLLTRGKKVEAIVAFMKVLERDPDHRPAAEALARLDGFRKSRIEQWSRRASEFFAKEELEKAAPYYRRILMLDPDNIRAKEGMQMLNRLRELKGRQGKDGS